MERVLLKTARDSEGRAATIFNGRRRTWPDLAARAAKAAAAMRAMGIQAGDRVAILGLNSDDFIEILFATWLAGGVVVPINNRWSIAENVYALNDSGARVLLAESGFLDQVPAFRSQTTVTHYVQYGTAADEASLRNFERLIAEAVPAAGAGRCGNDLAAIYYTGGTTGVAKGAMLSHGGLILSALSYATDMRTDGNSVHCHIAPLFHMGAGASLIRVSLMGGTHLVMDRFNPAGAVALMAEHRATEVMFVPTMLSMLMDEMDRTDTRLPDLETILYGSSPISETVLGRALAMFPAARFAQAYGQTELSPVATLLAHGDHCHTGPLARRLRSAGRPVPLCEVEVTDESGNPVAPGVVGEIRARGPNVMLGYWNKPELTAATLVDGWCRTGDMGYFDEDRYLYLSDRAKDMIISGGENVYSVEVENAIVKHPAVRECAVIGVPDDHWGEAVHAIVVFHEGKSIDLAQLREFCRGLIADYKCPRGMTVRTEPIPLSAVGKLDKKRLRAPFWAGRQRNVS
jgi:acyl-CoA synthetase (AMP-forming)/AMP-acid ligase II